MKILKTMAELLVNERILASVQSSGRFDQPEDYPALVVATGDTVRLRFRSGDEINHQVKYFGTSCVFEVEVPTLEGNNFVGIATSTPAPPEPETDDSLRARLWYIIAPEGRLASAIGNADGPTLDEFATHYGLKRRIM